MADDLVTLVPMALRTLLSETLFRAPPDAAFIINRGEPGFLDTLKSLSARTVSTPPGAGRKPIVSHANHVLFGLGLIQRAVDGDPKAFDGVDWDAAWKLVEVDDVQWADLLRRLEKTAQHVLDAAPQVRDWNEMMLTGLFATAGHTAYHLGAVRQMLRDVESSAGVN